MLQINPPYAWYFTIHFKRDREHILAYICMYYYIGKYYLSLSVENGNFRYETTLGMLKKSQFLHYEENGDRFLCMSIMININMIIINIIIIVTLPFLLCS